MASCRAIVYFLYVFLLCYHSLQAVTGRSSSSLSWANTSNSNNELRTYIVHVQTAEQTVFGSSANRQHWHKSFLPVTNSTALEQRLVYSYGDVISGFAAKLTEDEVAGMRAKPGFLQAYPDELVQVQTTRTPTFLGLDHPLGVWNNTNYGKSVIIGIIDTGITPRHPSFSGKSLPPPPSKWKGECEFDTFVCNNKLIGARVFLKGAASLRRRGVARRRPSPVDEDGHGTHVASTAAGMFVGDANVLGQAWGTAAGMAPLAHLAMYRVCDLDACANSDVLAGIDAAIQDGVDVLSISLGSGSMPFDKNPIAIGAFAAVEKGVFVSCGAGNAGPDNGTLSNEAPWVLTVAASTLDRRFKVTVQLGSGLEVDGQSVYQLEASSPGTFFPLIYAGASRKPNAAFCGEGSLRGMDVKDKIVLCKIGGSIRRTDKGVAVKNAGGFGMILMNSAAEGDTIDADVHVLPASHVSFSDGSKITDYINSASSPMAALVPKGTILGTSPAPVMAAYSSRGPSLASPGILKPDITGPGSSILAAWPFPVGPPSLQNHGPAHYFNVISGTSMSTPHLSGIAALIKSAHPDWSPAMIKSAIMTTADEQDHARNPILNEQGLPAGFFAMGAGHVNPAKAMDPGLVYDITARDYIMYLCGLGYRRSQLGVITGLPINCNAYGFMSERELNYPAILVLLSPSNGRMSVTRRVKNVGEAKSVYLVEIDEPKGVNVRVEPKVLEFDRANEERSFTVTFRSCAGGGVGVVEGQFRWVSGSGVRIVRSPVTVSFA